MIQRKQTLFLFEILFLGIALLFVPVNIIMNAAGTANVYLLPVTAPYVSTTAHMLAMILNFTGIILSVVTIFIYKKRHLQVKLSYALMIIWAILSLVIAFLPMVEKDGEITTIQNNYFGAIVGVFAIVAAFLAARFINKDIELLKSADRIR